MSVIKEEAARFGWGKALYSAVMSRLKPVLEVYAIQMRALETTEIDLSVSPAENRLATRTELLDACADFTEDELNQTFIDAALERGDICLGAFLDDKLVSYSWRSYTETPHTDHIWVRFGNGIRYAYKQFTLPEYRGRRLLLNPAADPICRAKGFERSVIFIATHNFASLRHNNKNGHQRLGYAGYLNLFGKTLFFRTKQVRLAGFEFFTPIA